MARWLLLLALVACSTGSSKPHRRAPRDCIDPAQFGAIVDDGNDDREAIQRAIDEAGRRDADVCLPAGELHVSRKPGAIASIELGPNGVALRGQGPASKLSMLDRPDDDDRRDWWVIKVTGNDHVLREFSMDGSHRGVTDEQTHLIQIVGPARRIDIAKLELSLPLQDISRGGDCMRMLGENDARVEHVTVTDVHGAKCARSFIAFQRFVSHVTLENVTATEIKNSAIDMEPSGDGAVEDVTIKHSDFRQSLSGSYTVSLAGSGEHPSKNLIIEDSTIEGSIQVYHVHGAAIRYSKVFEQRLVAGASSRPLITILQDSRDVRVENNILERAGVADAGISLISHNGGWPKHITIANNEIAMRTEGYAIDGEPVETIDIVGNTIRCGDQNTTRAAIFLRGVLVPIRGVRIRKNEIRGPCSAAVHVMQHENNVTGETTVEDNDIDGPSAGVVFENGAPGVKPVIDRNVFHRIPAHDQVRGSTSFAGRNQ